MKIAHIVSTYPPYYGGMGNVVFEMVSRLAERGNVVEVFTPEYAKKSGMEERRNVEDFARRLKPALAYSNSAYLPQLSRELDSFDIVHLHYPFFGVASLVARWKKRNPTKPLVITYHMDTRSGGLKGLFFKLYAEWFMPSVLGAADLLIASSFDYIRSSDAQEIYKKNKEKWIELPFGVDTERFYPQKKPIVLFDRHQLDSSSPTIIFVGGMDRAHFFKGVPVLLEALARCKSRGLEIQSVFVGEGELKKNFESQARGMGIESQVRFPDRVTHEELAMYYAMGDLCILPSTTRGEAFGMVLLEAAASGVPVVASDLPGVRTIALDVGEVCIPGSASDLAEVVYNFFSDGEGKAEASVRARAVIEEKYSWKPIIEKLEDEYRRLIA